MKGLCNALICVKFTCKSKKCLNLNEILPAYKINYLVDKRVNPFPVGMKTILSLKQKKHTNLILKMKAWEGLTHCFLILYQFSFKIYYLL